MKTENRTEKLFVDLHMHTTYSDGSTTPVQIVKDNALLGLDAIAISDHDTTSAYGEAKLEADKWGIELITGVEITTPLYHILGYNFDINNKQLQDLLEYSRKVQLELTTARVNLLHEHGVPLTIEKVIAYNPNARLGKTNIIYTLMQDAECRQYIENKFSKDYNLEDIFRLYVGKHGFAHFESKNYVKVNQVSVKEAAEAIHAANGTVIVAHPFKEVVNLEKDMKELIASGIEGLEIQPNFRGANAPFQEYAKKHNLITTYGSDFHGICFPERPYLGRKNNIIQNNIIQKFW